MRNYSKKIFSIVAAATFLGSAFALAGCKGDYVGDKLDGYVSEAEVSSNGGFAVTKGDYVYFINGVEEYTAENEFGKVTKGALMRISKTDLKAGKNTAQVVVPQLFVSGNYNSGIYIYGDRVYYATPTTNKGLTGETKNEYMDLKSAKLDGSETMKDFYAQVSSNSANYRFVEQDGVVYCLYEDGGVLKSFNTKTEKESVLVAPMEGETVTYYYDNVNLESGNVYYTRSVRQDIDTDNYSDASYNQLYCVNVSATAELVSKDGKVGYKTSNGNEYLFNKAFLEAENKEAKDNKEETVPYDFKKYETMPYVNLGELVLDGIGKNIEKVTQYNEDAASKADSNTVDGYKYTVSHVANGGVYFTRTEVTFPDNTNLYFVANKNSSAADWNTVKGNANVEVVSKDSSVATNKLVYLYSETDGHTYFYINAKGELCKENGDTTVKMVRGGLSADSDTLWKVEGDYLYYYGAGENGNDLSRINWTGNAEKYNPIMLEGDYVPVTIEYVDWNDSWYKPELIDDILLYSNAQAYGTASYNYIAVADLSDIEGVNEAAKKVDEYIEKYAEYSAVQSVMKYYYRTGKKDAYTAVEALYSESEKKAIDDFFAMFEENAEDKLVLENEYINFVGAMSEADAEAIDEAWALSLKSETETEEDGGLAWWAITLIVVGSVLVVAAGVTIPLVIVSKKKKEKKEAEEAIVNAHKRKKIDTTDDKSIDVYAEETEEVAEPVEETTEEVAEEPAEEAVEEVIEETVETEENSEIKE